MQVLAKALPKGVTCTPSRSEPGIEGKGKSSPRLGTSKGKGLNQEGQSPLEELVRQKDGEREGHRLWVWVWKCKQ